MSTAKRILSITAVVILIATAIGVSVGITVHKNEFRTRPTALWRPAIGNTWQIQLSGPLSNISRNTHNYDIDLYENNSTIIDTLHQLNSKAICYFSAGTFEDWRPDANQFKNDTLGQDLSDWVGERWLDTRAKSVRDIMAARIELAKEKGCDGIDPDNIDSYTHNNTGFSLTKTNAVNYVEFLAAEARKHGLAIGLKNGADMISEVLNVMDWEINESCAVFNECSIYQPFIAAGKPVFHIEYSSGADAVNLTSACNASGTRGYSTLLKRQDLDAWSLQCPTALS